MLLANETSASISFWSSFLDNASIMHSFAVSAKDIFFAPFRGVGSVLHRLLDNPSSCELLTGGISSREILLQEGWLDTIYYK